MCILVHVFMTRLWDLTNNTLCCYGLQPTARTLNYVWESRNVTQKCYSRYVYSQMRTKTATHPVYSWQETTTQGLEAGFQVPQQVIDVHLSESFVLRTRYKTGKKYINSLGETQCRHWQVFHLIESSVLPFERSSCWVRKWFAPFMLPLALLRCDRRQLDIRIHI